MHISLRKVSLDFSSFGLMDSVYLWDFPGENIIRLSETVERREYVPSFSLFSKFIDMSESYDMIAPVSNHS